MKMKIVITVFVALFFVFLLIGGATLASAYRSGSYEKNIGNGNIDTTKTIEMEGIEKINVDTDASSIHFTTDEKAESITAHLYGHSSSLFRRKGDLKVTNAGGEAKIEVDFGWNFFMLWHNVKLDVTIPKNYKGAIYCDSSAGKIDISNIESTDMVKLHSSAGEIIARNITGKDVYFDSSAGRITADTIKSEGTFRVKSTAGSISMDDITAKDIDLDNSAGKTEGKNIIGSTTINNSAGSVIMRYKEVIDDINIHCSAGSVDLYIPESTNADVDLRSSAGSVSSELPITSTGRQSRDSITGTIGKGGPTITAKSSAGSVELRKN